MIRVRVIPTLSSILNIPLIFQPFSTMRKVGQYVVPDLPAYRINPTATRQITKRDPQVKLDRYYDQVGLYRNYKTLSQCRYFAFEYKSRVYHVYNAYYYPTGRMINQIATRIRGKNSPHYKNNVADIKNGDICVIINAVDPLFTGKKLLNKKLRYHTGYIGNLKTFSYKAVLNKKPELLYYYLIRKAMPKNKISEEYMKNVKIFRGPVHDIPNVPQFAPEKFIEDPLTEVDFEKYYQEHKDQMELVYKAQQGNVGNVLGQDLKKDDNESPTLDTQGEKFNEERKFKTVNKYTPHQMKVFINRQKQIRRRYLQVRAPYKKKNMTDKGYEAFFDEKKAKKSPYYKELADQEEPDEDDEACEDPLKRKGFDK